MDDRPLCLLALDGGGIRGLSELVVLEEIMNRIKYDLDVDGDLLPADFFDLIGGTSTGGLVALLLGRLRRSVPQARREYVRIAEEVFSLPRYLQKNTFDGRKLEEAVKRLLGNDRSEEKMLERDGSCKVFVCAVPQQDVKARAGPRLFRTYRVRENASFNCTIWEACRATSAAPSYFEPIKIGDDGEQETFVDGGLGYNNPVEQVLEEARRIFPGRKVACVVSVGTGVASAIAFPDSPKTSPVKLIDALKKMATESDTTAEKMHGRFQNVKDVYFRFSVDRGLQAIGLEEWKELSNVRTFTTEYLNQRVISEQVNEVVKALLASKIVGQEGSNILIQLSAGSSDAGCSQGLPRTLGWRPKEGSIPSFHYTTEQLASHIVVPLSRRHWVVPFDRNEDFIGRKSALSQLLKRIPPSAVKDACQRAAIEGLGGVGKTQIALAAAFLVRDEHPDCHIFWVPAVDAATFENGYRKIGQQLQIPGIDDDKADVRTLVKTALSQSADNWLLIVDNADDVELLCGAAGATGLRDCLPSSYRGSILFTTRNHQVVRKLDIPRMGVVRVAGMSRLEAAELLQKHLDPAQTSDSESTTELLNFLADLPLAIKQASAYMDRTGMTTRQYLGHCRSSEGRLIELLSKDFEDRGRYKSTQNPIAATWLISFRHISRDTQLAAQYLRFMSLLAEKEIPKSLLPPGKSELEADEAIGTLKAYAFITERAGQESYDIHRLVRLAMRSWLSEKGELKACAASLIQQLDKAFPFPEHENRAVWVMYLPHALTALGFRNYSTDNAAESSLLFNVAESSYILGKYEDAEELYRPALKLRTEMLGAEHPATLTCMSNLAVLLNSQGKYKEAEAMHRQALKLWTAVLGAEHPSTLTSMSNLALVLDSQGKYKEAEGKYEEAEAMHRQALKLWTEVLGAEHPDTLTSMNNLALVLYSQGKYEEAEAMHRRR
ncbi:acyl transferase/acyl hydrolase/lysophospholipase [Achaetomium macrosporum]|uniref:Acyl transferase/acyl hydrolase/lysophospholipase n=1 Tax=Achaetomium macrosporum TaxID=79813 RepID=A0AAN7C0H8_9PEZI|nr:acyl transferase/acyl hydrolase/lysophospholipase [Achaetomium macrosporum]